MAFLEYIRRSSRSVATLGLAALVLLSIVMMADIAGRELFSSPISGFSDIADLIVVIAAAACFPASLANNQHVAVRFAGLAHWRVREGLDLIGHSIMLAVLSIIAYQLVRYTADIYATGQTTWLLYIPVWPVWVLVTALFILCVPVQLAQVLYYLRRFFSLRPLDDKPLADEQVLPVETGE
ncbi:TRAP transporter small permease [Mesorhizobium sp. 1B3]|uniref:TRAP transporter small permease n=1 Tax=Mesorhizobium sp. 1B3 TaxID=3243599 RepID=UPI003D964D5D